MSDDYLRKCCKSEGHGVLLKSVTSEYKLYAFPPQGQILNTPLLESRNQFFCS